MIPTPKATLLELLVQAVAEATNTLAGTITACNKTFWDRNPEEIVAEFNKDVAGSIEMLNEHTKLAQACNDALNAINLPNLIERAPTVMGRTDIVFNGSMFVYVPIVIQTPQPKVDLDAGQQEFADPII